MSVDGFGRQLVNGKGSRGPPGIGFTLTRTGDYSVENKKLCNLLDASEDTDAVNLKVLKENFEVFKQDITALVNEKLKKIDEKLTHLDKKIQEEFTSVNPSSLEKKYE